MRVAFVTARERTAVSVAAPYLASSFGARNVLVVRLSDSSEPKPAFWSIAERRIERWGREGSGFPLEQILYRRGVTLVHATEARTARESLNAFEPDLVVGVGLGRSDSALESGVRAPVVELRYGDRREETPEAAILWALHGGKGRADIAFGRLDQAHRGDVVYTEPVPILVQSSLEETVRGGAARLRERAGAALAGFAGWSTGLIERAVPLDTAPPRGVPSWSDLRVIRTHHGTLRRQRLATANADEASTSR